MLAPDARVGVLAELCAGLVGTEPLELGRLRGRSRRSCGDSGSGQGSPHGSGRRRARGFGRGRGAGKTLAIPVVHEGTSPSRDAGGIAAEVDTAALLVLAGGGERTADEGAGDDGGPHL